MKAYPTHRSDPTHRNCDTPGTCRARARGRGSAMAMVLLLLSFLAVAAFAVADLCVFNLHLAARFLAASRATELARAATWQFMDVFDDASARMRTNGLDLDSAGAHDPGLQEIYASQEGLPGRSLQGLGGKVSVTFDPSLPWHSTDNSLAETPAEGWCDRASGARSVAPFSVDLLINVTLGGDVYHYEAVVAQRWPYAAYSQNGRVIVCASPRHSVDGEEATGNDWRSVTPSTIEGSVATTAPPGEAGAHTTHTLAGTTLVRADGQASFISASTQGSSTASNLPLAQVLLLLAQIQGDDFSVPSGALVEVGPSLLVQPDTTSVPRPPAVPCGDDASIYTASIPLPSTSLPAVPVADEGNSIDGDVFLRASDTPGESGRAAGAVVEPSNALRGKVRYDSFPASLEARSPVLDAHMPTDLSSYVAIVCPPLPKAASDRLSLASISLGGAHIEGFGFLSGLLTLDPDRADCPPFTYGSGRSHFLFKGDLGNRFICFCPPTGWNRNPTATGGRTSPQKTGPSSGTTHTKAKAPPGALAIVESPGGLCLRNCVLYVDGNLDLGATLAPADQVRIEGTNATLIVSKTLSLSGGTLDAHDQPLVILARDVVLRASGTYRGLIIAQHSLTVLPNGDTDAPGSALHIEGAVMCGEQAVLRSVALRYDASCLKAIHGYGDVVCTAFRRIP